MIDHTWTTVEQVGNELRLHYATKSELESLQLDDAFFDSQKQEELKLKHLRQKHIQLQAKLNKLQNEDDGLTPLGRKYLSTPEKDAQHQEKIGQLTIQIEDTESDIAQIKKSLDQKRLLFNGWVKVRLP